MPTRSFASNHQFRALTAFSGFGICKMVNTASAIIEASRTNASATILMKSCGRWRTSSNWYADSALISAAEFIRVARAGQMGLQMQTSKVSGARKMARYVSEKFRKFRKFRDAFPRNSSIAFVTRAHWLHGKGYSRYVYPYLPRYSSRE